MSKLIRKGNMKKNPTPEETETEMLSTGLPKGLIGRVKNFCDENEITIQDFVTDAIIEKLALVHKERRKNLDCNQIKDRIFLTWRWPLYDICNKIKF